jgi:thiamine kinase
MAKKLSRTGHLMLDSVLAQWPLWSSTKPTLLQQLKGGLTNNSFLIQAGGKQWVLRINAKNSAALDLNRELEYKILSLPGINHVAPNIVYCDSEKKFLVTEYLPGKVWTSKEINKPKNIIDLALLLKTIHQLDIVDSTLDCQQKASNYCQNINNSPMASAIKTLKPAMLWNFEQARIKCTHHSLCHNDLLASNLLTTDDGRLYALDWEYAAMGDPYFDLAVIIEGNGLDKRQSELLLKTYLGNISNEKLLNVQQRLFHSRVIYCYLTLLWYVVQNETHGDMDNICEEKIAALNILLSNKY